MGVPFMRRRVLWAIAILMWAIAAVFAMGTLWNVPNLESLQRIAVAVAAAITIGQLMSLRGQEYRLGYLQGRCDEAREQAARLAREQVTK